MLVTGGLGFIGSHFVEELVAAGAEVICGCRTRREAMLRALPAADGLRLVPVDLRDSAETRAAFKYTAAAIDTVVHCAALDGNAAYKATHPAEILDANLRMTLNVLESARDHGVEEVVVLSSAEAYAQPGNPGAGPEDPPLLTWSDNGYVLSKLVGEVAADLFRRQYEMDVFIARTTNVYGPRDGLGSGSGRVIPTMLERVRSGRQIEIWGDGSQRRTFLYVTDLVRATLQMVEARKYPTFNVGSGESISILDLARTICAVLGRPERIHLEPTKPRGVTVEVPNLDRMREVIDFTPLALREGLARLI